MAGAHIEREARYEMTGVTAGERDKLILRLRQRHWSQARIAKAVGMTQVGVKHALDRLAGKPRTDQKIDVCDGCFRDVPANQMNRDGLCESCAE
jgi:predicted transcriptional regulator